MTRIFCHTFDNLRMLNEAYLSLHICERARKPHLRFKSSTFVKPTKLNVFFFNKLIVIYLDWKTQRSVPLVYLGRFYVVTFLDHVSIYINIFVLLVFSIYIILKYIKLKL